VLVLIFFIHDSMVISTDEWAVRVCQPPVQYLSKYLSMCLCDDLCVYTCHGTDTKPIIFVTVLEWVMGVGAKGPFLLYTKKSFCEVHTRI